MIAPTFSLLLTSLFVFKALCATTPCYNEANQPIFCYPEFANIVQNYRSSLFANSTCGSSLKEEKVCPVFFSSTSESNLSESECELCDSRSVVENRQHPIEHITTSTYFGSGQQLCWMSQPGESKPVMVEIDFGKLMDALYLVLRFCNEPATDVTIYKTSDFGSTWLPIHYITDNCLAQKGIDPDADVVDNQPSCGPIQKQKDQFLGLYSAAHNQKNYNDPDIQTRKLATGFRVVFSGYAPPTYQDVAYRFYSLASMEIGGQCQCNGHANLCKNDGTRTRCECLHNTYGFDCESCHPFFQDLPWQPATAEKGFECRKCSCSGHSDECYFDQEVFDRSGGNSGGVCLNCKHNTKGRFCHQCAEGFYRTPNTPIDSPDACTPCSCHQAGSLSMDRCDPITGQCMCKPNVQGRNCASCEDGYKISDNNDVPCVRDSYNPNIWNLPPDNSNQKPLDTWKPPPPSKNEGMLADSTVEECMSETNKVLKFDTYCKYDVVVRVQVMHMEENVDNRNLYKVKVKQHLYTTDGKKMKDEIIVAVPYNLAMTCITLEQDNEYYILADHWSKSIQAEATIYTLTAKDTVLKAKDSLERKVTKFRYRQLSFKC